MRKEGKKQYFVQIGNKQVEVSQEIYLELYKDQSYEKNQQRERRKSNILSFDAMNEGNSDVYDFIPDMNSNAEKGAIHRAAMHKIKEILKEIDPDDIISLSYPLEYSEHEISTILGIPRYTVNRGKRKILDSIKKLIE